MVSKERTLQTMSRRKIVLFSMILGTLLLGVTIGTMIDHAVNADKSTPTLIKTPSAPSPTNLSEHFSTIAKKVENAVVNISTETLIKQEKNPRQRRSRDPFEEFFERFMPPEGRQRSRKNRSLGSGFIVDKKGYIITNNHVINKADKITVKLASGEEFIAKVIGTDQNTDLAVLKIKTKTKLVTLEMGNSDWMNPGNWVLAIGSPFGLEQTLTAGIISATGRSGVTSSPWQRFLQTDAAINSGNSGGPLVNMSGEVIGVNTAIITPTGGNLGIGFALPSNTATNVYNQLVEHGKVKRGAIGIRMQANVKPQALKALGSADGKGVLIQKLSPPNGPAAKAGLKQGDIIVEVDGQKITEMSDMHIILATITPGTSIKIRYIRNGKVGITNLVVGDRDVVVKNPNATPKPNEGETDSIQLGITAQNLTSRQLRELDLTDEDGGVYVSKIETDSIAQEAGLKRDDVIIEINKKRIGNTRDLKDIVSELESGMDIIFLVKRWEEETREAINLYLATTIP